MEQDKCDDYADKLDCHSRYELRGNKTKDNSNKTLIVFCLTIKTSKRAPWGECAFRQKEKNTLKNL